MSYVSGLSCVIVYVCISSAGNGNKQRQTGRANAPLNFGPDWEGQYFDKELCFFLSFFVK